MKILDRYIFKELVVPFFLGLFVFTFVLLTNAIVKLMDLLIGKGIGFSKVMWFLFLSVPHLLVLTIPMSVLLAVLTAFGRLSEDSELTAFKSSGISLYRMSRAVIPFALITWIMTSVLFIKMIPWSNLALKQLRFDIVRTRANIGIKPHVFNTDFDELVIYVKRMLPRSDQMDGVFISSELDRDESQVIVAENGFKIPLQDQNKVILRLNEGCIYGIPKQSSEKFSINPFSVYDISLDMEILKDVSVSKGDREMTIAELLEKVKQRREADRTAERYWVEIHKKFSIPFACLVFVIIGVPLGITSPRGGSKSVGFVISLGLIIVYYIFLAGGEGLGDEGKIPPWAAMWAPNFTLGIIGLYLFIKVAREAPFKFTRYVLDRLEPLFSRIRRIINRWRGLNRRRNAADAPQLMQNRRFMPEFKFMRILDRYVAIEFLKIFFFVFIALLAVSAVIHTFEKIDDIVEEGAGFVDGALAILFRLPFFAFISIHYSLLVATLLTIGSLAKRSEITAMMAGGISYIRIAMPILVLSFLISGCSWFLNEKIIPITNRKMEEQWSEIEKRPTSPFVFGRRWFKGEKGHIYFYRSYNTQQKVINGFSLYRIDEDNVLREWKDIQRLIWKDDEWHFYKARFLKLDENFNLISDETVMNGTLDLKQKPEDFMKEVKESEQMNREELADYIAGLKKSGMSGIDVTPYIVDYQTKLSLPLLGFIMTLLGIPLAYQKPRSGGLMGVGISILIGAVYFVLFQVAVELGHAGILPPLFSAWIANLLFAFIGIYMAASLNK